MVPTVSMNKTGGIIYLDLSAICIEMKTFRNKPEKSLEKNWNKTKYGLGSKSGYPLLQTPKISLVNGLPSGN